MKPGRVFALEFLIVAFAMGAGVENSTKSSVDVYVEREGEVPFDVLNRAEETTAKIFEEIGISMHWSKRPRKPSKKSCITIGVQFESGFALGSRPDAIGYALPYSNSRSQVHIIIDRVLRCRVACSDPRTRIYEAALLGHVIAHEIGHVLQGVVRHSEDGLMKESWTSQEMLNMPTRRLSFTKSDADLIHQCFSSGRKTLTRKSCRCGNASDTN